MLFESWVASEIVKHRRNHGEAAGLSHYRDRHAAEADVVVEGPDRLRLVEAKAARTASPGLFAKALRIRDELARPSRPCEVVLVYGGDEAQRRSGARLVPWGRLHEGVAGACGSGRGGAPPPLGGWRELAPAAPACRKPADNDPPPPARELRHPEGGDLPPPTPDGMRTPRRGQASGSGETPEGCG